MTEPVCVLDARASLGEGAVWCDRTQALFWVDINAPALHRFDPATGTDRVWPMPEPIGCLALCQDRRIVVALATGLAWFDPATERSTGFCRSKPTNRAPV